MSTQNESNKKPDYSFNHIDKREHSSDQWTKVGAAWSNEKGYITVDSPVFGKFVLQPREELERMRAERKESDEKSPSQEMKQGLTETP